MAEPGQLEEDLLGMSEAEAAQYAEAAGWASYLLGKQAQTELRRNAEMFDSRRRQVEEQFDARQRQMEEMFDARQSIRHIRDLLALAGAGGRVQDLNEPVKDLLGDLALGKSVEGYPASRTESVNTIFDNTLDDFMEQFSSTIMQRATEQISKTVEELVSSDAVAKAISQQIKQAIEELLPDVQ